MVKHNDKWIHGSIVEKHETPRSYVVKTSNGKKYRRNRHDLKPTKSLPKDETIENVDLKLNSRELQPRFPDERNATQKL